MENKNSQTKTEQKLIEKYQKEIREAILNAMRAVRSCVLFYRDIYYALEETIKDEEEFRRVEGALWSVIDGLKLDDMTLYKIYTDPEESFRDVVVVSFGKELTEEQLRVLEEVASLFGADSYDKYSEGEEQFFESMPIYGKHRDEVYVVLHNLVKMWTGCGADYFDKET